MHSFISLFLVFMLALPVQAADCAKSWDKKREELMPVLALRSDAAAFVVPQRSLRMERLSAHEDDHGVWLPLFSGNTAILANDWQGCENDDANCEAAERMSVEDYFPNLGFWLVAGWQPRLHGVVMRLVDAQSGAVTLIGGTPHPSPSQRRAVVVAGDNPFSWSGTEIWSLDHPIPHTEWEQYSLAPADYAFVRWIDDDAALLAVRNLSVGQIQPLNAILACGGKSWHLIHNTSASWLDLQRSPSGRRHAMVRKNGLVIWQDGEQVFSSDIDAEGFIRWRDENTAEFTGGVTVVKNGDGWDVLGTAQK